MFAFFFAVHQEKGPAKIQVAKIKVPQGGIPNKIRRVGCFEFLISDVVHLLDGFWTLTDDSLDRLDR